MLKPDFNPDRNTLKNFGYIALFGYALMAIAVGYKSHLLGGGAGPIAIAFTSLFAGLAFACPIFAAAKPELLRPVWIVMMTIATPIGFVVSHVVMTLLYALVFTPVGLLLRAMGHDPMRRKFLPLAKTYWEDRPPTPGPERYFRPF